MSMDAQEPTTILEFGSIRAALDGATRVALEDRLRDWEQASVGRRVWEKDPGLWPAAPENDVRERLGWLELPARMPAEVAPLRDFSESVRGRGITRVVLLGMGGSSLAPGLLQDVYGPAKGYPVLSVLDSTHPRAVETEWRSLDPPNTLFLVSSKSGTTLEPRSFLRYFEAALRGAGVDPGPHLVAVSDPGTPLATLAREQGFLRVFEALPTVGGRYSALTHFGLLPAALIGVDIAELLRSASVMAAACGPDVGAGENPGLRLGAILGESYRLGRDKLTFYGSGRMRRFPVWLEQLVAESTGKQGRGFIPVVGEPLLPIASYHSDRLFVYLGDGSAPDTLLAEHLDHLVEAGHPVLWLNTSGDPGLGAEFFRWEMAVAASGMILGINPFDQPDVELAKELARHAMVAAGSGSPGGLVEAVPLSAGGELNETLRTWQAHAERGDYLSLQVYLPPDPATDAEIAALGKILAERLQLPLTWGYGPRFLHSTGQLHKGGPNSGLFLQLVDDPHDPVPVPGETYGFGDIIRAQSLGDFRALKSKGRRVIRIALGSDASGLPRLREVLLG